MIGNYHLKVMVMRFIAWKPSKTTITLWCSATKSVMKSVMTVSLPKNGMSLLPLFKERLTHRYSKGYVPMYRYRKLAVILNSALVLARANKSVRVFEHLVSSLAQGEQPDPQQLANVGYILRTTAVYGNGKFGIADFKLLEDNPDFHQSFSAQMCAVYLLREFSLDWIHYLAKQQGGEKATTLHRSLQRYLGVGNATGLGMAPYLINHPLYC